LQSRSARGADDARDSGAKVPLVKPKKFGDREEEEATTLCKCIAPAVAGAALAIAAPYAASAQNFDDPKEFQAAQDLLKMTPSGPEGKPWEQNLGGKEVDTSKYKKAGPYRLCFSNAGVDNP
jgi:hypothetical protein